MYDSIRLYTEKAYYYDFYQIQNSEFFHQLKPRIRHRLINALFGSFIQNFFYMFNDNEFEGGCEFTSDFCSNIYSRLYLPSSCIIDIGDNFPELIMVQEGVVTVSTRVTKPDTEERQLFEFFILPTFSYFGDYQILYDLKSQNVYKAADEGKLLITLCLKKQTLFKMMDDYPEARKFYMERAWQRRIEFRRRQRKFLKNIVTEDYKIRCGDLSNSIKDKDSGESNNSSIQDDDSMYSDESEINPDSQLKERLSKKFSKFYYINYKQIYDINQELEKIASDDDTDALAEISEDEFQDNIKELLDEDNKQISQEHAKNIHKRMASMSETYQTIANTLESNLSNV